MEASSQKIHNELKEATEEVLMLQKFFLAISHLHYKLDPQYVYASLLDILKEYAGVGSSSIYLLKEDQKLELVAQQNIQGAIQDVEEFILWVVNQNRAFTREDKGLKDWIIGWEDYCKEKKVDTKKPESVTAMQNDEKVLLQFLKQNLRL